MTVVTLTAGLLAIAGACDKKDAPASTTASAAQATAPAEGTSTAPNPEASAPVDAEPVAVVEPAPTPAAAEELGLSFEVTGAPFDGAQTWTIPVTTIKGSVFKKTLNVMGVVNPRVPSKDGSVTLGSLVLTVEGGAPGTYDGDKVDITLGLEKNDTGGQPMRAEAPHPFAITVTRWDDAVVAGTFAGTLVRTNDHDGDPDTFTVSGKFAYHP